MRILRQVLESVAAHAEESLPRECCGILLGRVNNPFLVSSALRAENAEKYCPKERYILGHKAHIEAVARESSGEGQILGYYHSHPDGETRPSRRDREQAVAGVTYLIAAIRNGAIGYRAWRLETNRLIREPLEVREQDDHGSQTEAPQGRPSFAAI